MFCIQGLLLSKWKLILSQGFTFFAYVTQFKCYQLVQQSYNQNIQKIEIMEKGESSFTVSPAYIVLNGLQDIIRFSVKNTANKTCHFQIFVPDYDHFKMLTVRTFSLAPGISKSIKIQHCRRSQCTAENSKIEVVDAWGNKSYVTLRCCEQKKRDLRKIEIPQKLVLQKLKLNQEKWIQIPVKNISEINMRIKGYSGVPSHLSDKIQISIIEDQMILLKNSMKMLKVKLRMLKEVEIDVEVKIQFIEEESKSKWSEQIKISCNSLQKSQFITDTNFNKIDFIQHELLNGNSVRGCFNLINNYHQDCTFRLMEVIQVVDNKTYAQRLQEITLRLEQNQGIIPAKGEQKIFYQIDTRPNQNDKNFTARYGQLLAKDEINSYKLRSSTFFKKNLDISIKVQFGGDNFNFCKLKTQIINPALRITKISQKNSEFFQITNDTGQDVPFKINNNLYFTASVQKGKLKQGVNSLKIDWRKNQNNYTLKQNNGQCLKCCVKMEIPQNQIVLFDPVSSKRPRTAMLRSESANFLNKQSLRERISLRAPTKLGDIGVRCFKEVGATDYLAKPNKYVKSDVLLEDQFKFLQINQNQKGNIITNSHLSKNFLVYFIEKGFLVLEAQHSYLILYEKRGIKFEVGGKEFEIKSKQMQDKQPYKIVKKQLLFCFAQNQKQFQVVKELEIVNKSNQFLMVYCLSVNDQYFHSLEFDNKILVGPKSTNFYKLSFSPSSERKVKDRKILRNLEFLINDKKQTICCEGDFLTADVQVDEKVISIKNCQYSQNEITKNVILTNSGLNKATFLVEHSQNIKITPRSGIINEKGKQVLTFTFCASKLAKNYSEQVKIRIKGSHIIKIPFNVNTLQPQIYCVQDQIDFGSGYINETLVGRITIVNKNKYACNVVFNFNNTQLKGQRKILIDKNSKKQCQFKLAVNEEGEKTQRMAYNFVELDGYGAIKGPKQIKIAGRKTILQIIPDNPFKDLMISQIQECKKFKIKNISKRVINIQMMLKHQQKEKLVIISCEPNKAEFYSGEEKQFNLQTLRVDQDFNNQETTLIPYQLLIYFNKVDLYRSIDFVVSLPPPQLQINPSEIYFPLACIGIWSQSKFIISNKGYKQIFIAIKKPSNIAFQFQYQFQQNQNRLTKLHNKCEVTLLFKSKKPISFGVILQIQSNYGKKYELKIFGTASRSPLLNCDKMGGSSSKGFFSNKQFKGMTSSASLKSISFIDNNNEQNESIRFFNKWIHGIYPQSAKDKEHFSMWLKNPKNIIHFLNYLGIHIDQSSKEDANLLYILEELKKQGYPLYTIQIYKLLEGNAGQWSLFLWFLLSKDVVSDDCLKWVNKICGVNLETYDNAFNHHKKVLIDLISRIMEPFLKAKIPDWQKIVDILEPSIPILSKIDNKRQFVLLLNLLFHKFSQMERQNANTPNLIYDVKLVPNSKDTKICWIIANGPLEYEFNPNCLSSKYTVEKKLLCFCYDGDITASLKLKEDLSIMVWNNSFYETASIIDISISKKSPINHNIVIQCQDKYSQQWKLEFVCSIQSEYFFQFHGGMQFRCKMPDLGVIQAGEILDFRIIYSPTNLKQHEGVLKICNKYEEHIYNLKGKPLKSKVIQVQRTLRVPQGQKWIQTFSIAQDAALNNQCLVYKIEELEQKTPQIKLLEAKSNKKEIIIQVILEFTQVVQKKEIILRVTNKQLTFCKNIRLIINVIPKPVAIQAEIKGIIEKTIIEKIPITNITKQKQVCFVSIHRINKEEYTNFNPASINVEDVPVSEKGQWQFKLSPIDKVILKPNQTIKIQLSYLPMTLTESYCQIRLRFDRSEQLIVYNFMGLPQLPCTDNPLMIIKCETEKEYTHTFKISNKLKQKVNFDVETSVNFIAGADQIIVQPRQNYMYTFKLLPLHAGEYEGQLLFKSEKFCLVYPLKVIVTNFKKVRKIRVHSKTRVTSSLSLKLNNKSEKEIQYEVFCKSQYIQFDPKFILPANSEKDLLLHFTPLFTGIKTTQIKLYNEFMQEICYTLEMVSQEHRESIKLHCQLGQKKKIKLNIKNTTGINAKIIQPKLPNFLNFHLANESFPLSLPAYTCTVLQLYYSQLTLKNEEDCKLEIVTDLIGEYNFDMQFMVFNQKTMPLMVVPYEFSHVSQQIHKQFHIQLLNPFDQDLQMNILSKSIDYNENVHIDVDLISEKFVLKPYDTKFIKCQVKITSYNLTDKDWELSKLKNIQMEHGEFKWVFPIRVIQIHTMKTQIQINGLSHQIARTRVNLKHINNLKNWQIANFPQFRDLMNITFFSSKDIYLEAIINKIFQYHGQIIFYDQNMICAERYPLCIKISGKKNQTVNIMANVGQKGRVDIKLKNGKGKFRVQLKNNKMKEFDSFPREGQFQDKKDNIIRFEYSPIQYNGIKKAEATIISDSGCFNFLLVGKFPNLK